MTEEPLDFEEQSAYTIRVRGTDLGGMSVEKNFIITATNAGPQIMSNGGGDAALVQVAEN